MTLEPGDAPRLLDRFAPAGVHPAPPAAGEIDVWSVPLDPPQDQAAALAGLLADDERARAERFRFARHRRRYGVGRGALRTLLGRYLGVEPRQVVFRYGRNEKPYLAGAAARLAPGLEFNLSNSDELAIVAFTTGTEVGADVERLRPMPDALAIAERFFSAAERRVLAATPEGDLERTFFRCWTRKEAYLKAVGTGITVPLDRFDVTLAAEDPPRIVAMEGDATQGADWSLTHLEPAPGYLGALAVRAAPRRLSGYRWSG